MSRTNKFLPKIRQRAVGVVEDLGDFGVTGSKGRTWRG